MSLKQKFLVHISQITQKRLNIKKPPTKNWSIPVFDTIPAENEPIFELEQINSNKQKIKNIFLTKTIFKVYYSSDHDQYNFYEKFSWTMENNVSNKVKNPWILENNNLTAKSELDDDKNITIAFDQTNGLYIVQVNDEKIFTFTIRENASKKWLAITIEFTNPEYKCFGLGEQTEPMDKNGKKIIFWNTDNTIYKLGSTPLYQSWPIAIIQNGNAFFAFIFDNPAFTEINLKQPGIFKYFVHDLEVNYYILFGPTLKDLMGQITHLTGTVYPVAKWALGYQQSRYSYTPSNQVREIAKTFREKNIPCDVIYLDIHYMERYKIFTFGPEFTDYKEMIKELHDMGFKIVPIIDPGVKIEQGYFAYDQGIKNNFFIKDSQNELITIKVWPGECHYPDFVNADARTWWASMVKDFMQDSGVDGIWCDMNEPATFDPRLTLQPDAQHHFKEQNKTLSHERIHNLFGFFMTKATLDGALQTSKTPFVMTRSTYLGGQKYATTWTGDNHSNWSHFKTSISMILSLGLSGQPIVGPDIGGFGGSPDAKLYERWITQGAFYPYSRTHTALYTPNQEPWSFGEEVEKKARESLKLRYKLIPYYYSLLYEAHTKGYPLVRPIFFNESNQFSLDKEYYESEFLLGDFLLFAPYMTKSNKRDVYLPNGYWYSWWQKDELFEGKTIYPILEEENGVIPIFLKDEAIIPMHANTHQFISTGSQNELLLLLVAKDSKESLIFNVIEYFDYDSTLGIKITMKKEESILKLTLEEIRTGSISEKYFLPKIIHFEINYFVRSILELEKEKYEIKTDKEDWSEVTLHDVAYPLNLSIETLF